MLVCKLGWVTSCVYFKTHVESDPDEIRLYNHRFTYIHELYNLSVMCQTMLEHLIVSSQSHLFPTGPTGALEIKIKDGFSLVTLLAVLVPVCIAILLILAVVYYRYKKRPFIKKTSQDFQQTNVVNETLLTDVKRSSAPGTNQFGSLTRQRTVCRKFSVKSRLSSTLTEQYFTADVTHDPEWEVDFNCLEFQSILGEGAFGRVIKGIAKALPGRPEQTTVAVKMLKGIFLRIEVFILSDLCTFNTSFCCPWDVYVTVVASTVDFSICHGLVLYLHSLS